MSILSAWELARGLQFEYVAGTVRIGSTEIDYTELARTLARSSVLVDRVRSFG
jgi:hypothetical protein